MKVILIALLFFISSILKAQITIYVSPKGIDNNVGTATQNLQSFHAAMIKALSYNEQDVTIILSKGTYFFDSAIVIKSSGYHLKSLHITALKMMP